MGGCGVKWKTKAVTSECLKTAIRLRSLPWLNEFYLAGGTALALTYGHRVSVDLDFFSPSNTLGFAERPPVVEHLKALGSRIEEQKDGTVHALYKTTHISFFRYAYPLLRPVRHWEELRVAHPLDIGLMKLGAVIGRGSRKDFVDLYVLLHKEITLPRLLKLAAKKFSDSGEFALQAYRALVYFADAEKEPPLNMLQDISWHNVKRFFETEVRQLTHSFK